MLLCWGASPLHLSQHGFELVGDASHSSDQCTFLKETDDYRRQDVRFTFNIKQTGLRGLYVDQRILLRKETTIIDVMLYASSSTASRVAFIYSTSFIISSICRQHWNDNDVWVFQTLVLQMGSWVNMNYIGRCAWPVRNFRHGVDKVQCTRPWVMTQWPVLCLEWNSAEQAVTGLEFSESWDLPSDLHLV